MNIPRLIAICGYKRCGKDTLSDYICKKYGHQKVKIAGKLKEIVKIVFGFSEEQVESDLKEEIDSRWGITPRQAMQFIGTEMFQYKIQELLPDIQRKLWIKSVISSINDDSKIVISDLRFLHEYIELKNKGFFVIKIEKDDNEIIDTHKSETEFLSIPSDITLKNNNTLKEFFTEFENKIKIINQIE
jgi:hypothetical protein